MAHKRSIPAPKGSRLGAEKGVMLPSDLTATGRAHPGRVAAARAGFLGGRWAASSGAEVLTGASFIAQVVSVNNPEDLRRYCYAHAVVQPGGGTICQLPPVWVLPPDRK